MIENLSGVYETVNYAKDLNSRLYFNDEYESYPPHWHIPYEVIMPVSGGYRVICEETEYILEEGDILLICPGVVHELFAPPTGKRVIFQPSLAGINLRELDTLTAMLNPCVFLRKADNPDLHSKITDLMNRICGEYRHHDPYAETRILAAFLEILVCLSRSSLDQGKAQAADSGKQQEYFNRFQDVCNYINEHFSEPITLEQAASMAGFSKYHFSRMFHRYASDSFYHYLNEKRIAHAKTLLIDKRLSIQAIALRSGFSSHTAFLRTFKQYTGCTPTEFRKMYNR